MGEFKVADASVLKQRVIKKARRRGTGASVDSSSGTGAFSGFGGLVKPSGNGSAKPFSFSPKWSSAALPLDPTLRLALNLSPSHHQLPGGVNSQKSRVATNIQNNFQRLSKYFPNQN